MSHIVVVEDDAYLREELIATFAGGGYTATGITCFAAPEQELAAQQPDLIVLDLNLPGKSGFELCKYLKARISVPILILTARDGLGDELNAIGLGADDYLTKPCHPQRLLARAERLLQTYSSMKRVLRCGAVSLDTDTGKLTCRGQSLLLPETEGKILRLLMENSPQLVTRAQLMCAVWGTQTFVDENILQVNLTRLRKNLAQLGLEHMIQTVRGQGYAVEEQP